MRLFYLFLLFSLPFMGLQAQKAGKKSKGQGDAPKVVIQLANGDSLSHKGLITNLKNLREGWPELQISVVCHGPGLKLLHLDKSLFLEELKAFQAQGVEFVACRNTMKAKKIPDEKIWASARRVDMGLQELILKQQQGWAYIKAGVTAP